MNTLVADLVIVDLHKTNNNNTIQILAKQHNLLRVKGKLYPYKHLYMICIQICTTL